MINSKKATIVLTSLLQKSSTMTYPTDLVRLDKYMTKHAYFAITNKEELKDIWDLVDLSYNKGLPDEKIKSKEQV